MYEFLGGITPTGAGYASVRIAPQVSQSYGPSAVNMSLQTLHGLVKSSWRRNTTCIDSSSGCEALRLEVKVPIGVRAQVVVPVRTDAGGPSRVLEVQLGSNTRVELWPLRSNLSSARSMESVDASSVRTVRGGVEVDVRGGGRFAFIVVDS